MATIISGYDCLIRATTLMEKQSISAWTVAIDSIWVSLIAGLDSPLEHGTGTWDWNVGQESLLIVHVTE